MFMDVAAASGTQAQQSPRQNPLDMTVCHQQQHLHSSECSPFYQLKRLLVCWVSQQARLLCQDYLVTLGIILHDAVTITFACEGMVAAAGPVCLRSQRSTSVTSGIPKLPLGLPHVQL